MRLYSTDSGLAREDHAGMLTLLDLPYDDIGELLRGPGLDAARSVGSRGERALASTSLRAPVVRPGKILIVGLNYPSHAEEALAAFAAMGRPDVEMPTEPNMQIVAGSATIGPYDDIRLPAAAPAEVDYEGELAVVIGRAAAHVAREDAWAHVAGVTAVNDLGARDIQRRAMTGDATASVGLAKSFDTFKPMGPCLVTSDEFGADLDLELRTRVNGEDRQHDRTSSFIHSIATLVAHLSRFQTLHPGDVICTGTPQGAGVFSQRFLRAGDEVEVWIEGIGSLRNRVVQA